MCVCVCYLVSYSVLVSPAVHRTTIVERFKAVGGLRGLYRGLVPGSISIFTRNGASMLVMQWAQRKVTEWGLRD